MFSLAYTPAYDPYHTVFRLLALLSSSKNFSMTYRTARTADFYLCFPWALKDMKAPRHIPNFTKDRNKIIKRYPQSSYDHFPSSRIVFERMETIQTTAASALAGSEMIDPAALRRGEMSMNLSRLSSDLQSSILSFRSKKSDLIIFLTGSLTKINDLGKGGVYARSGLGEFSYDVI